MRPRGTERGREKTVFTQYEVGLISTLLVVRKINEAISNTAILCAEQYGCKLLVFQLAKRFSGAENRQTFTFAGKGTRLRLKNFGRNIFSKISPFPLLSRDSWAQSIIRVIFLQVLYIDNDVIK